MPQGKCTTCKVAYRWQGRPLLRQSACPYCRGPLRATTYFLRWPWLGRRPLWYVGTASLTSGPQGRVMSTGTTERTALEEQGKAKTKTKTKGRAVGHDDGGTD